MASLEEKINKIEEIVATNNDLKTKLSILLVTNDGWFRLHNGIIEHYDSVKQKNLFLTLKADRGSILNLFSKIEFLVNKFIQVNLIGLSPQKAILLDGLLEYVDLFSRARMLVVWDIVDEKNDKEFVNLFNELKQVRNGLAHKWSEREVRYKNKELTQHTQFEQFKADINKIWLKLIQIYSLQQQQGVDSLLTELIERSTKP